LSGKTSLLNNFAGKTFEKTPAKGNQVVVNRVLFVDEVKKTTTTTTTTTTTEEGGKKTTTTTTTEGVLILQELAEKTMEDEEMMTRCDVVIFVYDPNSENSWKFVEDKISVVMRQNSDLAVVVLATKQDLNLFENSNILAAEEFCRKIDVAHVKYSSKIGNPAVFFPLIYSVGKYPHISKPKGEFGQKKNNKKNLLLLLLSVKSWIVVASIVGAVTFAMRKIK